MAKLPQTICHHDAMAPNLFAVRRPDGSTETVGIDWQMVGHGPAGAELALFVAGSVMFLRTRVGTLSELDRRAFEAYVDGLAETGARFDRADVAFAYAAASVLRMGAIVAAWTLNLAEDRAWVEGFWARPAEELLAHWEPLIGFLEGKAAASVVHAGGQTATRGPLARSP
jgi:hypothetical protein